MIDYERLERDLRNIKPYSRAYYIVKEVVDKWGHWKPRARGGSFRKGADVRRGGRFGGDR